MINVQPAYGVKTSFYDTLCPGARPSSIWYTSVARRYGWEYGLWPRLWVRKKARISIIEILPNSQTSDLFKKIQRSWIQNISTTFIRFTWCHQCENIRTTLPKRLQYSAYILHDSTVSVAKYFYFIIYSYVYIYISILYANHMTKKKKLKIKQ